MFYVIVITFPISDQFAGINALNVNTAHSWSIYVMQGDGSVGTLRERKRAADVKSGALKQIEEWATQGREQQVECGRNVGRLSDNVTEERLLKTRIWELSKERYKFLSQNEYEKRTFLDRQLRKNALFREITKNTDVSKSSGRSKDMRHAIERRESCRSLYSSRISTTSQVLPGRVHTPKTPGKARCQNKSVIPREPEKNGGGSMFQTEPSYPIRPRHACNTNSIHNPAIDHVNDIMPTRTRFGSTKSTPAQRKISFAVEDNRRKCKSSFSWYGTGEAKPTQDPRYQLLEHCLCENWTRRGAIGTPEISDVIQNNKSLHIPSKNARDSRTKTALKFQRLMSEQGLVF